jgi:acetyl esterase/lipase
MRKLSFVSLLIIISTSLFSQTKDLIYLWPGKVPGELKEKSQPVMAPSRNDNVLRIAEITDPAIEVRLADPVKRNGAGVIVCPGGGYSILAWDKEGTEIAEWLNYLGYSAFVLQYRVPDKKTVALQDAQRAIRIVRNNAAMWKVDPDKIGIMGFSAGGSLSARAGTLFGQKSYVANDKLDSLSCRPSFVMLIYPAYLDQGEGRSLTPELQITKETPPFFIFQTADDTYGNSALVMATAMRDAKRPAELHLLPSGGHGYGLRKGINAAETWPQLAEKWLTRTLSEIR